jgi:hypothetical protein
VLLRARNFGRRTQKKPEKNPRGRKNWRPNFSQIALKGRKEAEQKSVAEFSAAEFYQDLVGKFWLRVGNTAVCYCCISIVHFEYLRIESLLLYAENRYLI